MPMSCLVLMPMRVKKSSIQIQCAVPVTAMTLEWTTPWLPILCVPIHATSKAHSDNVLPVPYLSGGRRSTSFLAHHKPKS